MRSFRDEMNRLFDDFFVGMGGPFLPSARSETIPEFIPSVDVTESDGEVKITAELPGMTEKDVEVELDDERLTIHGEKKEESEEKEGNRYWRESCYGRFRRDIPLPARIESDKATASFKNGILRVVLPKSEESREKRRSVRIRPE